jgi:hypothetical protein
LIEIYAVFIGNIEYSHIKELEGGNFIGIDKNKVIYNITHDPMEIVKIDKTLTEVLK